MTGNELRAWRRAHQLTQKAMALKVGVSLATLSLWERRHVDDDLSVAIRTNNWMALRRYTQTGG